MALYFAMIGEERRGPFTLDQLHDAGVHPDTYVWCKGMDDWKKAEDVADICRYYRQRLFDRMHPAAVNPVAEEPNQSISQTEENRSSINRFQSPFPLPKDEPEDLRQPPMPTLGVAIAVLIFCFPPTGILAIYYSVQTKHLWNKADEIAEGKVQGDADDFRRRAHDCVRKAKMWIGITFFLGLIFYAFMVSIAG